MRRRSKGQKRNVRQAGKRRGSKIYLVGGNRF